jgi:hypothetical protein
MVPKAACGNDCESCPRYLATQSGDEQSLREVAVLWKSVGWRANVVRAEEIACQGCNSIDWCRYGLRECAREHGVQSCGYCREYPCPKVEEMLEQTMAKVQICREICTPEDFAALEKAFFQKEQNLNAARRGG